MKNRTASLAMLIAGMGLQVISTAQTISVAGPVTFGGPIGSGLNTVLTGESPVTTAFTMGNGVTVSSAEITEINTATYATEATVRIENSAFPGIFYATDYTDVGTFTGTFVSPGNVVRPWTTNGNNANQIPAASTWNLEFYETLDDGGAGADSTGANLSFTINEPPVAPAHTDLGTVTAGNPLLSTISSMDPGAVHWFKFNLATPIAAASDEWLSIWTGESFLDTEIGLFRPDGSLVNSDDNSGAGSLSAFMYGLMPGDPNSGYDVAAADATTLAAGDYYLAVAEFDATFALDFTVNSTGGGGGPVSLHLSRGVVQYPLNVSLPGPFDAAGAPGDPSNTVFPIATIGQNFVYPKTMIFSGQGTRNIAASALNQTRLRIRSSAFPGISTDYLITTSAAATINVVAAAITPPDETSSGWTEAGSNSLKGLTMPAGSTLEGELFDFFDNGAGADSTWSNLQIKMSDGVVIPTASAPAAVDLGVIDDQSVVTPITALTGGNTAAEVKWYKITLPADVNLGNGRYLNAWTSNPPSGATGALTDTVISIYDANGKYITNNDQGSTGSHAAFSFGASGYAAPWTPAVGDPDFNGHSGEGLKAGDYYIAVTGWTSGNGGRNDGFANNGGGGATVNGTQLNIVSNAPAASDQTLSGDLELSDTSISFASNRSISYQVKQGATVLSSGTITASSKNTSLGITVPASASGSAKLVLNGSTFLQRVVTLNLTGSNQSLGSVVMANGDADDDGEVGLNDIDLIITNYGLDTASADLDVDGEVGLNDIDIAIAHYGEGDESE